MEWGKMFVFALLLAGISFSAVSQAVAMERLYGNQVCKIEYYRDLVDLTGNYIPEADKISSRDVQWYETKIIAVSTYLAQGTGFFDQDLALLESTKGTKSLSTSIRTSNAHLRSAYTLYSQFATKYARFGGREARLQIASDRAGPMADYRQCVFCVSHPDDDRCKKCEIIPGSENVAVRVIYSGIDDGMAIPAEVGGGYSQQIISAGELMSPTVYPYEIENTRTAQTYFERENFFLIRSTEYDAGTDAFSSNIVDLEYRAEFVGSEEIPICPGDQDKTWEECKGTGDAVTSHRIKIKFMGEEWILSGIEEGIEGLELEETEMYQIQDAALHLAKEEAYGLVDMGDSISSSDGFEVTLDDISTETNENGGHPALISIYNANGDLACQAQIYPGETDSDLCTTGLKVHVYQTAPGLRPINKWAEMAIYSQEIAITENGLLAGDDSGKWITMIIWDSKGGATSPEPIRHLNKIIAWYSPSQPGFSLSEGESVSVPNPDGEDAFVLGFYRLPIETPESIWILSLGQTSGPELYDYNMKVGDKLEIGNSGQFIELQAVSGGPFQVTPDGGCAMDDGPGVASLLVGPPDNTYALQMGMGAVEVIQSNGIIVKVLGISEEVKTTP